MLSRGADDRELGEVALASADDVRWSPVKRDKYSRSEPLFPDGSALGSADGDVPDSETLRRVPAAALALSPDRARVEPWLLQPTGDGVEPGTWLAHDLERSDAPATIGAALRVALDRSRDSHAAGM